MALKGLLKRIPARAWLYVGLAAGLALAIFWHQHTAHKAIADAYARGKADEAAHVEKQAREIAAKANALNASISAFLKERNDETNRHIAADADALRLRGPGKAACTSDPGTSAISGQHSAAGRTGDAAVARLPYPDGAALIGMPFDDATRFAEQHDLNRAEVLTWREWYARLVAAWPKGTNP